LSGGEKKKGAIVVAPTVRKEWGKRGEAKKRVGRLLLYRGEMTRPRFFVVRGEGGAKKMRELVVVQRLEQPGMRSHNGEGMR